VLRQTRRSEHQHHCDCRQGRPELTEIDVYAHSGPPFALLRLRISMLSKLRSAGLKVVTALSCHCILFVAKESDDAAGKGITFALRPVVPSALFLSPRTRVGLDSKRYI